jgi:hypothetical protein
LATKMLASTVQFSRYGRSQPVPPRARRRLSRNGGSFGAVPVPSRPSPAASLKVWTNARALRTQQRA